MVTVIDIQTNKQITITIDEYENGKGILYRRLTSGMVTVINLETNERVLISKNEYENGKGILYESVNKGKKQSEETKKLQSLNRIGKYVGSENPFFGKTHSDETRKIISEAQKGKIWIVNSNNERTRIIPEQFEEYSKLGYKRGRKYR